MIIEYDKNSDPVQIFLNGNFDASSSQKIQKCFTELMTQGHKNFTIDLSSVGFIDSSGLGTLVGFFKKIKIGEGDLTLRGLSEPIFKIFQLTHLDKVFTIEDFDQAA